MEGIGLCYVVEQRVNCPEKTRWRVGCRLVYEFN